MIRAFIIIGVASLVYASGKVSWDDAAYSFQVAVLLELHALQ